MAHNLAYGLPVEALDIVLVDDHRGTQTLLRSMLSALRVNRVRAFDNAGEALRSMTVDPPSLVLTDWEMSPMSGSQLVRLMRHERMEPLCFVPIIMVTGHATVGVVEKAFAAGVHHMLVKPVSPARLFSRIAWVTRDSRQMRLEGERWQIAGVDDVIEKRIQTLRLSSMIMTANRRPQAVEAEQADAEELAESIAAAATPEQAAPERADRLALPRTPLQPAPRVKVARRKQSSWHGWRI
ncbi:MAG: response regulator [Aquamicrobium sp.]|uniref:response regulator n=1 Tax=Aquamicrobium sp. TaxID=1872579 RepID=UPI00349E77A8|nr:response regulator [Aquamicrobium sp.]